jgi:hypothetical protein
MKKGYTRFLFFAFVLFNQGIAFAGGEFLPIGARSAGLAHASVTLGDAWSVFHNPSGIAALQRISAGVYYENRFGLPETGLRAGAVALPFGKNAFGLNIRTYGYTLYSEQQAGLTYARAFGDHLRIGMQLSYMGFRFSEYYGQKSLVTVTVGATYAFGKNLVLGAQVFNPNEQRITETGNERVPSMIRFGARYRFSNQVFICSEVEQSLNTKPVLKAGIEYTPVSVLILRAGISGNPRSSSFGFGLVLKKFQIDMAGNFHPVLGFTPQFGLTFNPGS